VRPRLPPRRYGFGDTLSDHDHFFSGKFTWVDKSQWIPHLPDQFRYLLLRPPRFGKSAFLSILEHYYDLHLAANFTRDFGSLAVMRHPSGHPVPNQHLYLSFQLSRFAIISDLEDFVNFFNGHINTALECFVEKYAAELQVSDPIQFAESHESDLLASTLASAFSPFRLIKTEFPYRHWSQTPHIPYSSASTTTMRRVNGASLPLLMKSPTTI
jgi:hypothetical protein